MSIGVNVKIVEKIIAIANKRRTKPKGVPIKDINGIVIKLSKAKFLLIRLFNNSCNPSPKNIDNNIAILTTI